MVNFDPNQFVETQRKDWNRVSSAWEKWDAWLDISMGSCNRRLVERARLAPGQRVLDLGSGTGYPAIPAALRVGNAGHVTGVDLAEGMLDVARRKAATLGLKHVAFQACDVASLPFEDAGFDSVISRFCLMFLPHLDKTLHETRRVLKPGGTVAAAVWAVREKNPFLSIPMGVLKDFIEMPPMDPSIPGIFYLGQPGDLMNRMKAADFSNLVEEEVPVEGIYTSGREYLECLQEIAAPLQTLFAKVPSEKRRTVGDGIAAAAEKFRRDGKVRIPGIALVISGIRPS